MTKATRNLFQDSNRSTVMSRMRGTLSAFFLAQCPLLECLAGRRAPFPPQLLSEQHEGQAERDK